MPRCAEAPSAQTNPASDGRRKGRSFFLGAWRARPSPGFCKERFMNPSACVTAIAISALLGTGCASRSVPASFPNTSPASASAPEASRAPVPRALAEDPPLPGEPTEGWPGLRPAGEPAAGGHEQHRGQSPTQGDVPADHSGHGAPPAARPTGTPDAGQPPPAATYSCPMHRDVVSDRAGRCPRCGMALERRP